MNTKITLNEFIEKSRKVHGDKYDYSKVEYNGVITKVCIICPEHGEFWQTPDAHLRGQGCPECAKKQRGEEKRKKCENNFKTKASKIHNNKYDYSKTKYNKAHNKVCIICHEKDEYGVEHGEFWQTANSHLNGNGCPKCAKNVQLTTNQFIEKARKVHGDKYDYSKVEYISGHIKICIICPKHGEFYQDPYAHLNGRGCPKCAGTQRSNTEEFVEKARKVHGDKYDYSKVEYVNNSTPVCMICHEIDKNGHEHGEFWQTPQNHLGGKGCYKCNSKGNSKLALTIQTILDDRKIYYEREKTFAWLKMKGHLFLDFFLPEYNIAIECQGRQHFNVEEIFGGEKAFKINNRRDITKYELCSKHGIKIFYFAKNKHNYFEEIYTVPEQLIEKICKIT